MDSSWKKPIAKMVRPKPAPSPSSEEAIEEREAGEIQDAAERRRANEDQIGSIFGGSWYVTEWTNPVLTHPILPQLTVSRFYPESFVAVDIFTNIGPWEAKLIDYKRQAFKAREIEYGGRKARVRYGALSWSDDLVKLAPQLED